MVLDPRHGCSYVGAESLHKLANRHVNALPKGFQGIAVKPLWLLQAKELHRLNGVVWIGGAQLREPEQLSDKRPPRLLLAATCTQGALRLLVQTPKSDLHSLFVKSRGQL